MSGASGDSGVSGVRKMSGLPAGAAWKTRPLPLPPKEELAPLTPRTPLASYQPETQFAFFVDRLIFVNLYSKPTEMAKFTSNCEYDVFANGASLKV
jgi:hypothetical protein